MEEKFGLLNTRRTLHVDLDIFKEFEYNENSEDDHAMMYFMSNTIRDTSKICF